MAGLGESNSSTQGKRAIGVADRLSSTHARAGSSVLATRLPKETVRRLSVALMPFRGLFTIAVLILVLSGGIARANDIDVVAHFSEINPVSQHPQFLGVKINVLYSCVEAAEVSEKVTCERVRHLVSSQDAVIFIRRDQMSSAALNFFIATTPFSKKEIAQEFEGCSFRRATWSAVLLRSGGTEEQINRCVFAATLVHLGFQIDLKIFQHLKANAFERIVAFYTSE